MNFYTAFVDKKVTVSTLLQLCPGGKSSRKAVPAVEIMRLVEITGRELHKHDQLADLKVVAAKHSAG